MRQHLLRVEEWLEIQEVLVCQLVCLSLVIFQKGPKSLIFLIIAALPTIISPFFIYRLFSFFHLSNSCLISSPTLSIVITSWTYLLSVKIWRAGTQILLLVHTSSLELTALKSDSLLVLVSGAGAFLERGPDLCHLWTTNIQAANFINVFSCLIAHHWVVLYSDSHCYYPNTTYLVL